MKKEKGFTFISNSSLKGGCSWKNCCGLKYRAIPITLKKGGICMRYFCEKHYKIKSKQ